MNDKQSPASEQAHTADQPVNIQRDEPSFEKLLHQCFLNSLTNGENRTRLFDYPRFFRNWFKNLGTGYFFVFKRNLTFTNVQFGELLALIRTCTAPPGTKELQFVTTAHFRNWIQSVVDALSPDASEEQFKRIVDLYAPLFQRTLIVDSFYTSCSVFTPPGLELDLQSICAYSGYVHSCGGNVFLRKMDKTHKEHLFESLNDFVARYKSGQRLFFATYAHEDFTRYDREIEPELRQGLDGIKLFVEKFWMGSETLVSVLRQLKAKYPNFEVPEPGDYRKKHQEFRLRSDVDRSRTLWLITDRSINATGDGPGAERYFICYEQRFLNENAFHLFDENKPAWISHTTIPHTLAGAMINLTRPGWPDKGEVLLGEPFVGTGTIWLESLKFRRLRATCSDIAAETTLLVRDNLDFFRQDSSELEVLLAQLIRLQNYVESPSKFQEEELIHYADKIVAPYEWASQNISKVTEKHANGRQELFETLASKPLFDRVVFYLALRTQLRHVAAFERTSQDWATAYLHETKELERQIRELADLRLRESKEAAGIAAPPGIALFQGSYSHSCSMSIDTLVECWTGSHHNRAIKRRDVRDLSQDAFDVIITDPPYGFNTDDEAFAFAKLWSAALRSILLALKDGGQLVLCLPERSHTGRQIQVFTQKGFVTHQILLLANILGRELIRPTDLVPFPREIFRAPFYWESERALRRAILHFYVRVRR